MEVLSPRSANLPLKSKPNMKKPSKDIRPKVEEKPSNPDRIDDKWRPPTTVTEPGDKPETYITGKKLGKGGFAVCFEGKTTSTSEVFALKVVKAEVQQKKMMEKFRTEMQIHAKMQHPNIVEFYRAFSLEGHTYVVLEMCNNGSLTDMVKARGCLSLPEVRRFMIQICGGVKYMHKRSVIHRDLKMGNIFIDEKMNLKIGDFGLAAVMADEQDRRTTLCGTPNYIAPEILSKSGTRGHDYKVDTWAIGVICYAMLMGTPPFQSKTQQEIYTKLKTLEYEWKIDSINYIPQEAKDFVAACLNLVATERPDMDELVEYDFFTTGAIADILETSCLKNKPLWLENADPRGDRVRRGYGVDHGVLCSQCGVGKTFDGRFRPAVGGKAKISALVEIEAENRHGTAPTTPLPEGVLYKQFTEAQIESVTSQKSFASLKPRSRKPVEEFSVRSDANTRNSVTETKPSALPTGIPQHAQLVARPVQSFAAQQRQQALPNRAPSRALASNGDAIAPKSTIQSEEKPAEQLLRARPVRAASSRTTRSTQILEGTLSKSSTISGKLDELTDRLMRETENIEPRPKSAITSSLPTRSRLLRYRDDAETRSDIIPTTKAAEAVTEPLKVTNGNSVLKSSDRKQPVSGDENTDSPGSQAKPSPKHSTTFLPRLIGTSEDYNTVSQSSQPHIIKSLRTFHSALGLAPNSTPVVSTTRPSAIVSHPRVDKWVDYATKYGIAYILTDGSLGMILKSQVENSASTGCIVVRNARRHTIDRARAVEHQLVPQGHKVSDIEVYEQIDPAFSMKRVDVACSRYRLDVTDRSNQSNAVNALQSTLKGSDVQRVKDLVLLDKFGRYMNKQMGASDYTDADTSNTESKNNFIHFFQRMGNVGVWRFASGGLQFNFPDHTKLIIHHPDSNDEEILIDAVYLEPKDAKDMSTHGRVGHDALERRGLRTFRLQDIRDNSLRRSEMEIIRTNEIREKLSWIRAVLGVWIKEGGLGWVGEDKLGWSGMQERRDDKRIKLQWLTVGRPGGDHDPLTTK